VLFRSTMDGKTPKQQFKNAVRKAGVGGFVLGNNSTQTLFKVISLGRKDKLRPIYSYQKGRDVSVSATGFMKSASIISSKKIKGFYIKEAKKQIDRLK